MSEIIDENKAIPVKKEKKEKIIKEKVIKEKVVKEKPEKEKKEKVVKEKKEKKEKPIKAEKDDNDEIVYSIHLTNVHTNCTIPQIFESLNIFHFGEITQIVVRSRFPFPENDDDNRQCDAFVYFKGTKSLLKKHILLQKVLSNNNEKKVKLVHFDKGEAWIGENNTVTDHFRYDEYVQKRLIIQSIDSSKNSIDINWLFREHGDVEQVDLIWIKCEDMPTPTRCQSYIYFKEWGGEIFTYKLLEELNEVGTFSIKYSYNGYNDILWVYELSTKDEFSSVYEFEYGKYINWIPKDDPKYGSRYGKHNKLNWFFSSEGRFAYSERIVEDEIIAHGGLFIGPDRDFFKVEATRKPLELSWNIDGSSTVNGNIDLQQAQQFILEAIQKCLNKSMST
jgi:hypothetical protein